MNLTDMISRRISGEPAALLEAAVDTAGETNTALVFVGGLVRDLILDRPVYDIDFMVEPPAGPFVEKLARRLSARTVSHSRFLTYALTLPSSFKVDVVTSRTEIYPIKGALPEVKEASIVDDLKRRDFTLNAMACWLSGGPKGELIDPLHGLEDLEKREIKIIHEGSFVDDPTRVFRAARFAGRFGFQLEGGTRRALDRAIQDGLPRNLSPVRRRNELILLLKEENPEAGLALLAQWGALTQLHPALSGLSDSLGGEPSGGAAEKREWRENFRRILTPLNEEDRNRVLSDLEFQRDDKKILGKDTLG